MEGGFRSLGAPGLGAQQTTQTLLDLLEAQPGVRVRLVAPGRINLAASRRPGWAVVACVATIWIAGLGLFFLLVRRTEAGEVTVTDGPRGCVVTLPPVVGAALEASIAAALAPGDPGVPAPPSVRAAQATGNLDDRTVARSEAPVLPPPPDPVPSEVPTIELRFAAGTVVVEAGVPVVLGRDPSPVAHGRICTVPGDASSVSKAHLRVAFDGVVLTVEDLGSTNGSVVRPGRSSAQALVPGTPVVVEQGDEVELGVLVFTVGPELPGGAPVALARTALQASAP